LKKRKNVQPIAKKRPGPYAVWRLGTKERGRERLPGNFTRNC